jgi:hypothetical protein
MFSPPAKRARAAPEELAEKEIGGPDTSDGAEVNVGATLKQLQADFLKFQRESADAKRVNKGKVRELERRLPGAGKDPCDTYSMPPPLMPPPPGVGAGKSDLATEIAELKAQLAELKGSPPPRQNAEPGALRDILVGLLDEDGKGLPNKADNEKKLDKEAMRRKLCTSVPYQLSELKKDRLGMQPEEAQTIQKLWDALQYWLDQEAEFHMDTQGRMAELTKVLRTAQGEAVQELAIIAGPLRHHGAEQKAQEESLFVAKLHRRSSLWLQMLRESVNPQCRVRQRQLPLRIPLMLRSRRRSSGCRSIGMVTGMGAVGVALASMGRGRSFETALSVGCVGISPQTALHSGRDRYHGITSQGGQALASMYRVRLHLQGLQGYSHFQGQGNLVQGAAEARARVTLSKWLGRG